MRRYILGLILGLLWTGHVMAIEEPRYEVILADGPFEIRRYAPVLIAETLVEGDMDEASNKGFRLIADFIFGNNQGAESSTGEKIAMTAPVTVEPQQINATVASARQWHVNFVMPSRFTLASIPKPKNSAVTLREVPSKHYIVLQYSGFNTMSRVQSKTQEATEWALKKNLKVIGTPQLSRYDPPWTLPMFRRNEIMVEISAP